MTTGRITAVSITDNPGGNPALSPDAIGRELLDNGMDVIVHFTCRDTNRVGMESRALQLARMGMRNILALNRRLFRRGLWRSRHPGLRLRRGDPHLYVERSQQEVD